MGLGVIFVDGRLISGDEGAISARDHGLLVGDGVFETSAVYGAFDFARRRHLARLAASARAMGLAAPPDEVISAAMDQVLAAQDWSPDSASPSPGSPGGEGKAREPSGRLRITLTSGPGPMGSQRGDGPPTLVVAAETTAPVAGPAVVAVAPWPRNPHSALAGVKSTSYGENVVCLAWARERGACEALLVNLDGQVCEGTGSNLFAVGDGVLLTPPLSSGCLAGITRELVLELAAKTAGLAVEVRSLTPADLARCQEVFLTSSIRQVQPVSLIDSSPVAQCPGPVTAGLMRAYSDLVSSDLDP
ncbi:MAG: aminotransferase class IV [Acidimicrobiales bacterium]